MTTGIVQFDARILDLAERENECDDLFEEIKNGNGDQSLRYIALRDFCKGLRKEIFRSAMTAGLTRERIKLEIREARNQRTPSNRKQT